MLKMIKGVKVDCAEKLYEEYEIKANALIANINEEKILKVINEFVELQSDPLFLIIEVPSNLNDEERKSLSVHTYKDVYYIDNISKKFIKKVMKKFGNLFVNDGMGQIGIGNHLTNAEIMTDKYNVITIYGGSDDLLKYEKILVNNKIKKVNKLVAAWNYFSKSHPGESNIIVYDGKTIYDAVKILEENAGLYLAERREDI